MEKRKFGRTNLKVSRLTFGCGAVGGLMTKGSTSDQDRAVAWARDHGINFFDTAASYGDGASEINLGRALRGSAGSVVVSTKVGLTAQDLNNISPGIERALDASLRRLNLDHVDIFQLHNPIGDSDTEVTIGAQRVLEEVAPAFERLRDAGKIRYLGFTAKGEPGQLHELVASERFDSAQIFYNLLVPTAGEVMPTNHPADDFRQLLHKAEGCGVASIGVRVLAGGALSGTESRHPLGLPVVAPIGSSTDYPTDVRHARLFQPLVKAGFAKTLSELAIRYVISNSALSTTEIGIASLDELQGATDAVNLGPLSEEALGRIRSIQQTMAGPPS